MTAIERTIPATVVEIGMLIFLADKLAILLETILAALFVSSPSCTIIALESAVRY
ncbi:hypothetical protein PM082_011302 [Marasmius tenuissimus]|nr:hypothetical protein PM082_011302 [Marasmius tenuissimus]